MIREEIDKNDKISVKHEIGFLKVEIKSDSVDDNIAFVGKRPSYLWERLRHICEIGLDVRQQMTISYLLKTTSTFYKLEFDAKLLAEMPFIDTDTAFDTK